MEQAKEATAGLSCLQEGRRCRTEDSLDPVEDTDEADRCVEQLLEPTGRFCCVTFHLTLFNYSLHSCRAERLLNLFLEKPKAKYFPQGPSLSCIGFQRSAEALILTAFDHLLLSNILTRNDRLGGK